MPLSLEQYAELLDKRGEPLPLGPKPIPFENAKPHLPRLEHIKCVVWGGYGVLLLIAGGKPFLLNPDPVMRKIALEKTIHEFKMWQSMTRKPGEPWQYMQTMIRQLVDKMMAATMSDEMRGELLFESVWQGVLGRLMQKEYTYDVGMYGNAADYSRKIAYFCLRASQGVTLLPNELPTLRLLASRAVQAIHANGQTASSVQLLRALAQQHKLESLSELFDRDLSFWSCALGCRKETDRGFRPLLRALADRGWSPPQSLYVGSDVELDIVPAKRRGFRTALMLVDKNSSNVKPQQLRDEKSRPDCLITAFEQIAEVV